MWYYEEGLDQPKSPRASTIGSMVSRLLDQARESGLVEVKVHYPLRTDAELVRGCGRVRPPEAQVLAEPPG